ncbi:MAG: hypothetical protein M3511_03745 [Deinococcota bacterium]|nr:hypothetical protein [Deinococcota bacterium]
MPTPPCRGKGQEKPRYQEPQDSKPGCVIINKTQYVKGVPPEVWGFYIGGYQVCRKWLEDRLSKGRLGAI